MFTLAMAVSGTAAPGVALLAAHVLEAAADARWEMAQRLVAVSGTAAPGVALVAAPVFEASGEPSSDMAAADALLEIVAHRLKEHGRPVLMGPALVERATPAAESPVEPTVATQLFHEGRQALLDLSPGEAIRLLEDSSSRFEEAVLLGAEPAGWRDALFYLASAYLAGDRPQNAEQTLAKVARHGLADDVPPGYFSPRLAKAFEAAKKTLPKRVTVEIASSPGGATVLVDGQLRGTTPLTLSDVTSGLHLVRIELQGHRSWYARTDLDDKSQVGAELVAVSTPLTWALLQDVLARSAPFHETARLAQGLLADAALELFVLQLVKDPTGDRVRLLRVSGSAASFADGALLPNRGDSASVAQGLVTELLSKKAPTCTAPACPPLLLWRPTPQAPVLSAAVDDDGALFWGAIIGGLGVAAASAVVLTVVLWPADVPPAEDDQLLIVPTVRGPP